GLYLAVKMVRRRLFMRTLRMARISPEDLAAKLVAGEAVFIVDLRSQVDVDAEPMMIRGAVHMAPAMLENGHVELPHDPEVVLYCTRPNEAMSARVALLLRKQGVARIRPLAGGFHAWKAGGFPVVLVTTQA